MTHSKHEHDTRLGVRVCACVMKICPSPASIVCTMLIALTLLAYVTPLASGSDDLCDRSLHAGYVEYELAEVSYEIEGGEFLGLCVNSEYRIFDIFLVAGPGGELDLEMPNTWFDPRQFDHQACDFGYGINGGISKHEGVRTEIAEITDQRIIVQFYWDVQVSQISYATSPAVCLEKYDVLDSMWDTPLSTLRGLLYGEHYVALDAHCTSPYTNIVHLNYTISGGKLDRVCSIHEKKMVIDISPDTLGELIIDIPIDIFPLHRGGYNKDGGHELVHPITGKPVDAVYGYYPFSITTWNKYQVPYSTMEFYHADIQFPSTFENVDMQVNREDNPNGVSMFVGCRDTQHPCFPIPFFWGRHISKISSHDSFDRYSIPFGADDARIVLWVHGLTPGAQYYGYHPERYNMGSDAHSCRDFTPVPRA